MSVDRADRATGTTAAEPADEPLLRVEGLTKHFVQSEGLIDRIVGDSGIVRAVDGVDLEIRPGETLGVVGESGCGKSTLGRTILNLDVPTAGTVEFDGEDIAGFGAKEMRPYRRRMQIIFQDPLASLNPRQTIGEILAAPMEVHGIGDSNADRMERVEALLKRVGLKPGHRDRYPHQFSGGQQQRVGIARALAVEPDILIADEPVSALDVSVQAQILTLLNELQAEFDIAVLFIGHDLSVIRHVADRVAVMYLGELVETAPVGRLFDDPQHPYTRSLLSSVPRIDPDAREDRVVLEGTVPSPLSPPSACRFHTRCPVVIPPPGWPGDQATFKACFTFRNRVMAGELDPAAMRRRLMAEGRPTDDKTVAASLVDGALPGDLGNLPPAAGDAVEAAAAAVVADETALAREILNEAFPSPCEEETPRSVEAGTDHVAACHRIDPDYPAKPKWPN